MILINPIPGQEEENAKMLEEHNAAIWLQKKDDVNAILSNLFDSDSLRTSMKKNSKNLSRPNSTKDICDILLKGKEDIL